MTREEAIKWLKLLKISPLIYGEYHEAIDMAIEALSQPIVAKHFDIQSGYIYCSPQDAENVKVVVRCKDCRHRDLFSCPLEYNDFTKDEDFCSWGERRDGINGFKSVGQAWNTSQERRKP